MSKKATNYFIEDWGDRKPHEIIIRYDETELSLTVSDIGNTMQTYADGQNDKLIRKIGELSRELGQKDFELEHLKQKK